MPTSPLIDTQVFVTINGNPIPGLIQATITTTNCFSADSFALTFATGPAPLSDVAYWSLVSSAFIDVSATTANGALSQDLISGMIDTIIIDPIHATVTIEGRDLSSSMIDGYRQQDFVNQTASEVISAIAEFHGLIPMVTATSGNIGRYYSDGYTRLSLGQFSRLRSDWDLAVQLARENSYDVFVQGTNLFFQPSNFYSASPVHLQLSDVNTIRFERTLTIASASQAFVQSWNSQNMTSYTSNGSISDASSTATASDQAFLFSASNFTSQQVTDSAARYTAELGHLVVVMHIEMPWDLALCPRMQVFVDETDSILDTTYQIDHIERHYSTTSGSLQTIRAVII